MASARLKFNQAKTDELLRMIPVSINVAIGKENFAYPLIQQLIREGADPSGGPYGSTFLEVLKATSNHGDEYTIEALTLAELLFKMGADPNHTFTTGGYYDKFIKKPWSEIMTYNSRRTYNGDAALFTEWFDLLAKYGFDFNKPDLLLDILSIFADYPAVLEKRAPRIIKYLAAHGTPMNELEKWVEEEYPLYSDHKNNESHEIMRNTIRGNIVMRMGIGAGAGAGGHTPAVPTLRPHIKAKITSFLGGPMKGKGRKTRRRRTQRRR